MKLSCFDIFVLQEDGLHCTGFTNGHELEVELLEPFELGNTPVYEFDVDELMPDAKEDFKDYLWYKAKVTHQYSSMPSRTYENIIAIPKAYFEHVNKI